LRNIVVDPFLIGAGAEIILKSMQALLTQIKPGAKGYSDGLQKATLRHFRHCGTQFRSAPLPPDFYCVLAFASWHWLRKALRASPCKPLATE
jgi:hypothetical protein